MQQILTMHKNKENITPFTIHDLRATFGVNLLLSVSKHVNDIDQVLPYIQSRMGHRNIMSTIRYVRYVAFSKVNDEVDNKFESILFRYQDQKA